MHNKIILKEIMENINVYVKCYYPHFDRSRCLSVTGCKMLWIYLQSDAHFNDLLQCKVNGIIENSIQSSGQTLSELYIDVFWDRDRKVEQLSINFDFYTKEGGHLAFNNVFEISFTDMNRSVDTAKKGYDLRKFLLKETKQVDKGIILFFSIELISVITSLVLAAYGLESNHYELFFYVAILILPLLGNQLLIPLCISPFLPKKTEYKTNFDSCIMQQQLDNKIEVTPAQNRMDEREESTDIWEYLLRKAQVAEYSEYSGKKLVRGKFGKIEYGASKEIAYVLLSDRFLVDRISLGGYFYNLKEKSISCGGFDLVTGERHEYCKVIEIEENISEEDALERYMNFCQKLENQ